MKDLDNINKIVENLDSETFYLFLNDLNVIKDYKSKLENGYTLTKEDKQWFEYFAEKLDNLYSNVGKISWSTFEIST